MKKEHSPLHVALTINMLHLLKVEQGIKEGSYLN